MVTRRTFIKSCLIFVPTIAGAQLASAPCRRQAFQSSALSAEPELSDWVSRVQGRGSDVTGAGVQAAVADFIIGLKTDGLWTRAYRIGVYAGDTLAALEAPLLRTAGAAIDTMFGFTAGNYSVTGLTGGAGLHIKTGFDASMMSSLNDFSMGVYLRASPGAMLMGCQGNGSSNGCYLYHDASHAECSMWGNGTPATGSDAGGTGFILATRIASNDLRIFRNGTQVGSTQTSPGSTSNLLEFFVHDAYLNDGGTNWAPTSQSISHYWFGKGCDGTQQGNLQNRVQTLQAAFSRQV